MILCIKLVVFGVFSAGEVGVGHVVFNSFIFSVCQSLFCYPADT
jgi:hypothetical protein